MELRIFRHLWGVADPGRRPFPSSRPPAMPASKVGCLNLVTRGASAICRRRTGSATSPRFPRPAAISRSTWHPSATGSPGPRRSTPCWSTATGAATRGQRTRVNSFTPRFWTPNARWASRWRMKRTGAASVQPVGHARPAAHLPRSQAQLRFESLGVHHRAAADNRGGNHRAGRRALPPSARPRRLRKRAAGGRSPRARSSPPNSPRTRHGGT